jgi:hypothetical protein
MMRRAKPRHGSSGRWSRERFTVLEAIRLGGVIGLTLLASSCADGQTASTVEPPRTVDDSFEAVLNDPAFSPGEGPVVCIDEAHNNFHTAEGTYRPFARVLEEDGYRVRRSMARASPSMMEGCAILVIADAQPPAGPRDPPTFSREEVQVLNEWVREGGALFLITDHRPDPGAVADLATSFGVELHNGYVLNGAPAGPERPLVFSAEDGTLTDDPLLRSEEPAGGVPRIGSPTQAAGAMEAEVRASPTLRGAAIRQVATFTGSALRGGEGFRPLLVFGPGQESWQPEEYWVFEEDTPRLDVSGWCQGGVQEHGAGRLAVFGEAAMFTAQVFDEGRVRAGMNAPEAADNLRLLRRILGWLSGSG